MLFLLRNLDMIRVMISRRFVSYKRPVCAFMVVSWFCNPEFIWSCCQVHQCLCEAVSRKSKSEIGVHMFGKVFDPHKDSIDVDAGDSNIKAEKTMIWDSPSLSEYKKFYTHLSSSLHFFLQTQGHRNQAGCLPWSFLRKDLITVMMFFHRFRSYKTQWQLGMIVSSCRNHKSFFFQKYWHWRACLVFFHKTAMQGLDVCLARTGTIPLENLTKSIHFHWPWRCRKRLASSIWVPERPRTHRLCLSSEQINELKYISLTGINTARNDHRGYRWKI